jgi:GTP cyclohydrolase II
MIARGADVPQEYSKVKEDLVVFKDDRFKVYNGGPIVKSNGGVQWIMPVVFENEEFMPRAVYEIAFINCSPKEASGLRVFYVEANDIDVKFKNQLNDNYRVFSSLINGNYGEHKKYVVIRKTDIAMVAFPDVYVGLQAPSSKLDVAKDQDLGQILSFLETKCRVRPEVTHVATSDSFQSPESCSALLNNSQQTIDQQKIIFSSPVKVRGKIKDRLCSLYVTKVFMREDPWKVYYIISKNDNLSLLRKHKVFVRVDSGCVSGQIYDDDSCDCADQFFDFILKHVADDEGIVLHVPCHDGRGFGFAPKAETEIYKQGGTGRIHSTKPMDTISSAKLLYKANDYNYDIRDYEGVASILTKLGCNDIRLYTDNRKKVNSLLAAGINVERIPTETHKSTCKHHIEAKKNNPLFFQ